MTLKEAILAQLRGHYIRYDHEVPTVTMHPLVCEALDAFGKEAGEIEWKGGVLTIVNSAGENVISFCRSDSGNVWTFDHRLGLSKPVATVQMVLTIAPLLATKRAWLGLTRVSVVGRRAATSTAATSATARTPSARIGNGRRRSRSA